MRAEPDLRSVNRAAMGAEVSVTTDASAVAVRAALAVVATLEHRLSRFDRSSELSRLNAADGPSVVRPSTAQLLETALAGRALTDGWFDPTCGEAVRAAGYTGDHAAGWGPAAPPSVPGPGLEVDGASGLVHLPPGMRLDLGGIAKGWAADTAATLLSGTGATHAGVSVGGDLRIRCRTRALVEIEPPAPDRTDRPMLLAIRDGGVAVSGPTKRRTDDGRHHLIDPTTGRPAAAPRVAVVVAATATGAEMLATAAAVAPRPVARRIVERAGATAWLVEQDGALDTAGTPERFVLDDGWLAEPARRQWAR